jgi:hypothetical protein
MRNGAEGAACQGLCPFADAARRADTPCSAAAPLADRGV